MLIGRPTPSPGEPLFLEDDTAAAVALAEEERDACPSCGWPKAWCRDKANQFAFDAHEEMCWPTWRLAQRRDSGEWKSKHPATQAATMLSARFRQGHEPDVGAGLELGEDKA